MKYLKTKILSRIRVDDKGCWIWQGYIAKDGYGRAASDSAHAYAFKAFRGAVPEGLQLDHLCRVPACVNPDHLEPVTQLENRRRRAAAQTHCKRGHGFTPENTYVWRGHRNCRKCQVATVSAYKGRKRAAMEAKS